MDQIGTLLDLLLLLAGPVLLGYAVVSYLRTVRFIRSSTEVAGEVIRLEHSRDRTGNSTYESYAPVFSFTAADGKKRTVTSDVWSSPADFSVGESVRVRYDPANPQDARIHSFLQTWGGAVISAAVGAMFFGVALYQLGHLHNIYLFGHGWSNR